MKKIILFTFLLLGNIPIWAKNYIPYMSSSIGFTNTSISISGLDRNFSDTQILGNLSFGLEVYSKLRLETNFHFRTAGIDFYPLDYRGDYGQKSSTRIKGKLSSHAMMGNVFYKIDTEDTGNIWIGAGIGQMTSKATLTMSFQTQPLYTDTDNDLIWALYFLGDSPLSQYCFFEYGIEFYQWKVFRQKINNVSPRLGLRFIF